MGNLSKCLPVTLKFEGGFSDDPRDPGNWTGGKVGKGELRGTKCGIAASAHPNLNISALTDAQIAQIYEAEYWRPIAGDTLPAGVDLAAFDYAVNSGVGAAQKALAATAGKAPVERVKAICARRLSILQSLKTWRTFGRGWSTRVAQVQAQAIKMAAGGNAVVELQKAATQEQTAAKAKGSMAGLAGTPAIMAATPQAQAATGLPSWALWVGVAIFAGAAIWAFFEIRRHENAAAALTAAAKEA